MTTLSPRRTGVLLFGVALALAGLPAVATATPTDPAALVDPFVGTGSGGAVVGDVDTFPGAALPVRHGAVQPGHHLPPGGRRLCLRGQRDHRFQPDPPVRRGLRGSRRHPVLTPGRRVPGDPTSATQPFSHTGETASPGCVRGERRRHRRQAHRDRAHRPRPVDLPAQHAGAAAGEGGADSANGSAGATFQTVGNNEITGSVTSGHFCGQPDSYTVYFAATFSQPFTATGTWGGTGAGTSRFGRTARR